MKGFGRKRNAKKNLEKAEMTKKDLDGAGNAKIDT